MAEFMIQHPYLFTIQVGFVSLVIASVLATFKSDKNYGEIHHHYYTQNQEKEEGKKK